MGTVVKDHTLGNQTDAQLARKADEMRLSVAEMTFRSKAGHIGGSMSELDLLTALFYRVIDTERMKNKGPGRDYFVLSKGHSSEGYYSILADWGFFPKEELKTYAQYETRLMCHPSRKVPGVEIGTGALGHGVSVAVGIALGLKRQNRGGHVYVLMGDGEQAEGSVWEAAMAAGNYGLDNLTAIVDRNHLQISGSTENVMKLDPLAEKYRAFGFDAKEINGHDFGEITGALTSRTPGKPTAVIANTIKGKGISFIQNQAVWHHKILSEEQYEQAVREIKERLGDL